MIIFVIAHCLMASIIAERAAGAIAMTLFSFLGRISHKMSSYKYIVSLNR
jgi:hypothetical protein